MQSMKAGDVDISKQDKFVEAPSTKAIDQDRIPIISGLFRLSLTTLLLIALLSMGFTELKVTGVLLAYLLSSLIAALLIFARIEHPARLPVIASFDVLMVSYFSWGVGALSSPVAILYLPMVIAFAVQRNRGVVAWGAGFSVASYLFITWATYWDWIPAAPFLKEAVSANHAFLGTLIFSVVVTAAISGSYFFVSTIIARLDLAYEHERAQRLEIEQQRQRSQLLEDRIEALKRLESLGRLAGGIAHNFNNLLTGAIGFTQLGLDRCQEGELPKQELEEILGASRRAAGLTKELLAFSRRQAMKRRRVDLNKLLANLQNMLRQLIGEHIHLELSSSSQSMPVLADAGQLDQVFVNLVLNARDALPMGGKISIITEEIEIDEMQGSEHQQLQAGLYARCLVRDEGEGMSAETLAEVFEPFFTTKAFGQGTGLGLSTVYGILKQHEGHIHIRSQLNQGTEVELLLPLLSARFDEDSDEWQDRPMTAEEIENRAPRLLVVEDEGFVRRYTVRILKRAGFWVHDVANGREALEFLQSGEMQIDLLLSDVVMPHMSGPELVQEVRQQYKNIKVLLMSGYPRDELRSLGFGEDFADFIEKPFNDEELVRALNALGLSAKNTEKKQ